MFLDIDSKLVYSGFPSTWFAKGISLKSGLVAVWFPSCCRPGQFLRRWRFGYLIRRGWPLGAARKALVVFGGFGVLLLIPTIFTVNLYLITLLFGLATFPTHPFDDRKRPAYRSL